MNTRALRSVTLIFNAVSTTGEIRNFYAWVTNFLTEAMATALYGEDNPLTNNTEMQQHFWAFEAGTTDLLVKPFPKFTAPRAYQAREQLHKAFTTYFSQGKHSNASALIRERFAVDKLFGVPLSDSANLVGVAILSAALANTHALLYWLVVYMFHDVELLVSLREELAPLVEESVSDEGIRTATVDTTRLTDCSLFRSTFTETVRIVCVGTSIREVVEDTVLSTKTAQGSRDFLLRKGSMVQIPAGISHRHGEAWDDPETFKPERFLRSSEAVSADRNASDKLRKQAFHAFGGGKHLCPGRYLTYSLLEGIVATLVLGFDITGEDGAALRMPASRGDFTAAVVKPTRTEREGYRIRIRRRQGWEDVEWGHRMRQAKSFLEV
jgi:cytochrome P450